MTMSRFPNPFFIRDFIPYPLHVPASYPQRMAIALSVSHFGLEHGGGGRGGDRPWSVSSDH